MKYSHWTDYKNAQPPGYDQGCSKAYFMAAQEPNNRKMKKKPTVNASSVSNNAPSTQEGSLN